METAREQKMAARRAMRARRRALEPGWVAGASARIQATVGRLPGFRQARAIGAYLSLPYEVQTADLIQACWGAGQRVAVPVYDPRGDVYIWGWYEPGAATAPGRWRIPEPASRRPAAPDELELVLVPCVAVDRAGYRLGHGGGYYDRLLAETPAALRLGLLFAFQVVDSLPVEMGDARLDAAVTEEGVLRFTARAGILGEPEGEAE